MKSRNVLVVALLAWLQVSIAVAVPKCPEPGGTVADLTLPDVHRRPRTLSGYKDRKALVIAFLGVECPLANLAVPKLVELHKAYATRGVQFLIINANEQDTFAEVSGHAQERSIPFSVLKDFDQKAADAFGATRTPEFFLLDSDRVIRYHGRLDDQFSVGFQKPKPTRHDLKEALEELLAGKPVSTPATEFTGCLIGRADKPRLKETVTYSKQVSRIVQQRCQECHRPGQIGPMSLLTYNDLKDWSATVREVVIQQRMPPWHADPRFGEFKNDRHLSREETNTLLAWIEQGCLEGDQKDLPQPVKFVEGWSIGQPDLVVEMNDEFEVPATGVLDYQKFVVDPGFKEDRWVQLAESRPGNRAVVHHILVYILAPDKPLFAADGTTSMLVGWAPGDMPARYPLGMASRIPAGSKLVFEVHYTPNGTVQKDRSSVGIVFAKEPPAQVVETNIMANMAMRIPAGAAEHSADFHYTFRDDALVLGFMPHMHLRGVRARYVATYPDGKSETLLFVPDYDFNWQSSYRFRKPLEIPRGTKLTWTATWDNSADNPRNPDSKKEVIWGLQTWDEMQNGWLEVSWRKTLAEKK